MRSRLIVLLGALFVLAGAAAPGEVVRVAVSIAPLAFLVEKTAGPYADVTVLVKPGQSPETYDPTPKHLAELMEADLYCIIGLPFEARTVEKIKESAPQLRIVDLREGIALRPMTEPHAHEGQDPPQAGNPDPHIWLSARNLRIMAETVCRALSAVGPDHAATFRERTTAFQGELDALDGRVTALLAPVKGRSFYVYHPAYGYFADAYGLKQVAVEVGGREPSAKQLAHLIDGAKAEGVRVVFVQPQFSRKSAETVAQAIGGVVAPMDPLARDCLKNIEEMAGQIRQAAERSGK